MDIGALNLQRFDGGKYRAPSLLAYPSMDYMLGYMVGMTTCAMHRATRERRAFQPVNAVQLVGYYDGALDMLYDTTTRFDQNCEFAGDDDTSDEKGEGDG